MTPEQRQRVERLIETGHYRPEWAVLSRSDTEAVAACLAALEAAEQERDDWRLSFETVNDALDKAEAKLAQAPPRAEAVRVLEEAWWRGRRSVDHLPAVHANGPKLTSMCNNDIASLLPSAALRAEGEGGK
jgi:hypothetical protein